MTAQLIGSLTTGWRGCNGLLVRNYPRLDREERAPSAVSAGGVVTSGLSPPVSSGRSQRPIRSSSAKRAAHAARSSRLAWSRRTKTSLRRLAILSAMASRMFESMRHRSTG
jgi:hypothetical protein